MVNGNPTGWEKAADVNAKHNQTTNPIPKVEPMQIVYFTHKANETAEIVETDRNLFLPKYSAEYPTKYSVETE